MLRWFSNGCDGQEEVYRYFYRTTQSCLLQSVCKCRIKCKLTFLTAQCFCAALPAPHLAQHLCPAAIKYIVSEDLTFLVHQDIVMTLKEKLSLSRIEHFSLVLEQQHSISKLLLLHDEERIQQVQTQGQCSFQRVVFVRS